MPHFVAVDGEGTDTNRLDIWHENPDYMSKEHIYTLLAASNNTFIENWKDGLHTAECLDFLLSLKKPGDILVGFSFGYDSNMILRDLSPIDLTQLWENGSVDVILNYKPYRIRYLPGKWFSVSLMSIDGMGKWRIRKSAKVWDVFGFFQHSFIKSLEEWFLNDPACSEDVLSMISTMKERRGDFKQEGRKQIISYCLEECRLLVLMMDKLNAAMEDAGIYLKSWHGAGAISGYLMEQGRVGQHVRWDELPEDAQNAALWAYYGGRIELFQQGLISGDLYEYDLVSAYPSTIIDLPSLKYSAWYECEGSDLFLYEPELQYSLWLVEWDTRESADSWLAPFPQRGTDGSIYWVQQGKGWYHGVEVRAAKKVFGPDIKIIKGIYMIPDTEEKPFAWLRTVIETRILDKKEGRPRHIPKKLGANSIYGKLAQGIPRNGKIPRHQNYYLAGLVTAATRAKIMVGVSQLLWDDVVAIATDSVTLRHSTSALDVSGDFGTWEEKPPLQNVFTVQAGVYFTPDSKVVRTRGFNARSVGYKDCLDAWYSAVSRDTWHVNYTERRFTGLGYAANTGNWNEYRRWVDRDRQLLMRTEPRKVVDETCSPNWDDISIFANKRVDDIRTEPFVLEPGEMLVPARPYSPRMTSAEMVKAYTDMLDWFEAVEQEEYSE